MNAKRFLLLVPSLLLPYLALGALDVIFIDHHIIGDLFNGDAFLFLFCFLGICAVAFCLTVIAVALGLVKGWDATYLAKTVMIIKCVQIPAYIAIFVLSVMLFMSLLTIPFVLLLACIDACCIVMTGLMGSVSAVNAYRQGKCSKGTMIWTGISSYLYCVDVVMAIVFYVQLKKKTAQRCD